MSVTLVEKMALFSNAIEPEFFEPEIIRADDLKLPMYPMRRPHSFIWSSSPDRGLDELLSWWPAIRQLWPDASLNIYYGWDNVNAMLDSRPWLASFKARVQQLARQPGVTWHGRIGQRELAQRAMETQFWVYPSKLPEELGGGEWHETFCITALEMQAAGVIPVMAGVGALPERFYFGGMSDGPLSLGFVLDELERLDKYFEQASPLCSDHQHAIKRDYNWPAVTSRLLDIVEGGSNEKE
jgi:glycosyltransferase involved in cell wall biosynthesis